MNISLLSFMRIISTICCLLCLNCAHAAEVAYDPFAPVNRKIYKFNKAIDAMYLKPISMVYKKTVPQPIKSSVNNFINNLGEVPSSVNQTLQGEFKYAVSNVMRLLVNSTFGICGLFDVATPIGFTKYRSDLGQTFMKWGYKQSAYIVVPLLGPSTVRDGVGGVGNNVMSVPYYFKPKWRNRYLALNTVHKRADLQDLVDVVDTAGVDEYVLVRDAYLQRRQYSSTDGQVTAEDLNGPPE